MLNLKELTPNVYYNKSRDFQFLCHLFEAVLNAVKTDAELLKSLPYHEQSPNSTLDLLAYTLGLHLRGTRYTNKQLLAICKVFPLLLRNKGSLQSIDILCAALFHAEGLSGDKSHYEVKIEGNTIILTLPAEFTSITLVNELLTYIVPAGVNFYIQQSLPIIKSAISQEFTVDSVVTTDVNADYADPHALIPQTNMILESNFDGTLDLSTIYKAEQLPQIPTTDELINNIQHNLVDGKLIPHIGFNDTAILDLDRFTNSAVNSDEDKEIN